MNLYRLSKATSILKKNCETVMRKVARIIGPWFALDTFRSFTKTVALITAICFLYSSVLSQALYAMVAPGDESNRRISVALNEFSLPYSIGRITDAKYLGSERVVINIQDLHCHSEVQRNISRILSILDEKYHLSKVYVEGGIGAVDTSWVNLLQNNKYREAVVTALLDGGVLSGSEYYSIRSNRHDLLQGIEDADLYTQNLVRLGTILDQHKEIQSRLPELKNNLNALKDRYYSNRNRKLEEIVAKHADHKMTTEKYYNLLFKLADKAGVDRYRYQTTSSFMALLDLQKRLSYPRISKQLAKFINSLKQRMPYDVYQQLMAKASDKGQLENLYVALVKVAKEYRLELTSEYRELNDFFTFVDANQKINPLALVREEKQLLGDLHARMAASGAEQEVSFLSDFFGYVETYLGNKISAEDYEYYVANMPQFKLLWSKYTASDNLPSLDKYCEVFDTFYSVNVERNGRFLKNFFGKNVPAAASGEVHAIPDVDHLSKVTDSLKDAKEVIVVVTGGFHTTGLTDLLRERDISYLVITPNVTQDTKVADSTYTELAKKQARLFATQAFALYLWSLRILKGYSSDEILKIAREKNVAPEVVQALEERKTIDREFVTQFVSGALRQDPKNPKKVFRELKDKCGEFGATLEMSAQEDGAWSGTFAIDGESYQWSVARENDDWKVTLPDMAQNGTPTNFGRLQHVIARTTKLTGIDQKPLAYAYLHDKLPGDLKDIGVKEFTTDPRTDLVGFEKELEGVLNTLTGQNAMKYILGSATYGLQAAGPRFVYARAKIRNRAFTWRNEIIGGRSLTDEQLIELFSPKEGVSADKRLQDLKENFPLNLIVNGIHSSNSLEIQADYDYALTPKQLRTLSSNTGGGLFFTKGITQNDFTLFREMLSAIPEDDYAIAILLPDGSTRDARTLNKREFERAFTGITPKAVFHRYETTAYRYNMKSLSGAGLKYEQWPLTDQGDPLTWLRERFFASMGKVSGKRERGRPKSAENEFWDLFENSDPAAWQRKLVNYVKQHEEEVLGYTDRSKIPSLWKDAERGILSDELLKAYQKVASFYYGAEVFLSPFIALAVTEKTGAATTTESVAETSGKEDPREISIHWTDSFEEKNSGRHPGGELRDQGVLPLKYTAHVRQLIKQTIREGIIAVTEYDGNELASGGLTGEEGAKVFGNFSGYVTLYSQTKPRPVLSSDRNEREKFELFENALRRLTGKSLDLATTRITVTIEKTALPAASADANAPGITGDIQNLHTSSFGFWNRIPVIGAALGWLTVRWHEGLHWAADLGRGRIVIDHHAYFPSRPSAFVALFAPVASVALGAGFIAAGLLIGNAQLPQAIAAAVLVLGGVLSVIDGLANLFSGDINSDLNSVLQGWLQGPYLSSSVSHSNRENSAARSNFSRLQRMIERTTALTGMDQKPLAYAYLHDKLPGDLKDIGVKEFSLNPRVDLAGFEKELEGVLNTLAGQNAMKYILGSATFGLQAVGARFIYARERTQDQAFKRRNEIIGGRSVTELQLNALLTLKEGESVDARMQELKKLFPMNLLVNGIHSSNSLEIQADFDYALTPAQFKALSSNAGGSLFFTKGIRRTMGDFALLRKMLAAVPEDDYSIAVLLTDGSTLDARALNEGDFLRAFTDITPEAVFRRYENTAYRFNLGNLTGAGLKYEHRPLTDKDNPLTWLRERFFASMSEKEFRDLFENSTPVTWYVKIAQYVKLHEGEVLGYTDRNKIPSLWKDAEQGILSDELHNAYQKVAGFYYGAEAFLLPFIAFMVTEKSGPSAPAGDSALKNNTEQDETALTRTLTDLSINDFKRRSAYNELKERFPGSLWLKQYTYYPNIDRPEQKSLAEMYLMDPREALIFLDSLVSDEEILKELPFTSTTQIVEFARNRLKILTGNNDSLLNAYQGYVRHIENAVGKFEGTNTGQGLFSLLNSNRGSAVTGVVVGISLGAVGIAVGALIAPSAIAYGVAVGILVLTLAGTITYFIIQKHPEQRDAQNIGDLKIMAETVDFVQARYGQNDDEAVVKDAFRKVKGSERFAQRILAAYDETSLNLTGNVTPHRVLLHLSEQFWREYELSTNKEAFQKELNARVTELFQKPGLSNEEALLNMVEVVDFVRIHYFGPAFDSSEVKDTFRNAFGESAYGQKILRVYGEAEKSLRGNVSVKGFLVQVASNLRKEALAQASRDRKQGSSTKAPARSGIDLLKNNRGFTKTGFIAIVGPMAVIAAGAYLVGLIPALEACAIGAAAVFSLARIVPWMRNRGVESYATRKALIHYTLEWGRQQGRFKERNIFRKALGWFLAQPEFLYGREACQRAVEVVNDFMNALQPAAHVSPSIAAGVWGAVYTQPYSLAELKTRASSTGLNMVVVDNAGGTAKRGWEEMSAASGQSDFEPITQAYHVMLSAASGADFKLHSRVYREVVPTEKGSLTIYHLSSFTTEDGLKLLGHVAGDFTYRQGTGLSDEKTQLLFSAIETDDSAVSPDTLNSPVARQREQLSGVAIPEPVFVFKGAWDDTLKDKFDAAIRGVDARSLFNLLLSLEDAFSMKNMGVMKPEPRKLLEVTTRDLMYNRTINRAFLADRAKEGIDTFSLKLTDAELSALDKPGSREYRVLQDLIHQLTLRQFRVMPQVTMQRMGDRDTALRRAKTLISRSGLRATDVVLVAPGDLNTGFLESLAREAGAMADKAAPEAVVGIKHSDTSGFNGAAFGKVRHYVERSILRSQRDLCPPIQEGTLLVLTLKWGDSMLDMSGNEAVFQRRLKTEIENYVKTAGAIGAIEGEADNAVGKLLDNIEKELGSFTVLIQYNLARIRFNSGFAKGMRTPLTGFDRNDIIAKIHAMAQDDRELMAQQKAILGRLIFNEKVKTQRNLDSLVPDLKETYILALADHALLKDDAKAGELDTDETLKPLVDAAQKSISANGGDMTEAQLNEIINELTATIHRGDHKPGALLIALENLIPLIEKFGERRFNIIIEKLGNEAWPAATKAITAAA